ncbi:YbaB/EbfC family nucleoid-associated protein [Streptomyces sp. NBC_01233]|uniref:YbaB/EbfC family nucleoid-associated protein n=1 Tax=Streptomyces sp. NBC_01233 TaxID=2903787 RepID=UPI002E0FAF4F|nr:YbaB/EbfC family nucleoid-associated protein [Streptomyces sp. NBC_01233]
MSESMEDRVAKAMADLKATEKAVAKAEAVFRKTSWTGTSADRSVQVTVGSKGELESIDFLDGKYRQMAASQLADAVLQASADARADMARQVIDMLEPLTRKLTGGSAKERLGVDWEKLFGPLRKDVAAGERTPSPMSRLRDEIDDEEEEGSTRHG